MGIFGRIGEFFSSCIRPSTVNNEENRRIFGPTVDYSQNNSQRQAVASTSDVNYGESTSTDCTSNTASSSQQNITVARKGDIQVTPHYSLQTVTLNLTNNIKTSKGEHLTLANNVMYLDEWTACTAIIVDEFDQPLGPQHAVEVTSDRFVEFRECKLESGRFHFIVKSLNEETITIFFHVRKHEDFNSFVLSKKIQVKEPPSSSVQTEMTIKRINVPSGNECVFQVSIVDALGMLPSHGSYKLDILSSGENEVIHRDMHSEPGHTYFNITVAGGKPWSRDLVVILNGKVVPKAEKIEVSDKLKGLCCSALRNANYSYIPYFVEFYGTQVFIPLSTGDDDGTFVPYNEHSCKLLPNGYSPKLLCKNIKEDEILGAGSAHIKNIKRVLELKYPMNINAIPGEESVTIDLSNVQSHLYPICQEVVQHLLRGLYYRRKASEAATVRMEWKNRVATLDKFLASTTPSIKLCKFFRDHFGSLMNQYNREACNELFQFFNFQRDESEVDLHGLLVADENKLELLRLNLLKQSKQSKKVDGIIKKFKLEGDEAIRKLEEKLENFDLEEAIRNNTPWLEIIVGAGRHSRIKNEQNIRPKVEKLLKERNLKFAAVNKGALVVTFITYNGPEPCFGEYYCENCDRCWKSSKSYVGKYQICFACHAKCWPVKQRREGEVKKYYHEGGHVVPPVKCKPKPRRPRQPHHKHGHQRRHANEECVII